MHSNDTQPRRRLTDILTHGQCGNLRIAWERTEVAADFVPLPAGTYECHVHSVQLFIARTGTPGVKIRFDVCEGEHTGRALFHDCWLTPAALPQTKRDCLKLGLDSLDKLESAAVPPGRIRCKVNVALRRNDDGAERNRVTRFVVLREDEPQRDPFAPSDDSPPRPGGKHAPLDPENDGGGCNGEPADGDATFNFGANAAPEGADHERR